MKFDSTKHLQEIADLINAKFVGDPKFKITGINEIHVVESGDIVFVDHPKYYEKALNSAATTILINKEVECPEGKALLISEDPFRDFNKIIKHFNPFISSKKSISDSAVIGEGTIIQPNVFIGNNVTIGKNCLIHPNVTIYDNSIIRDNVIIHSNTVLGADAFYYKTRPEGYDQLVSGGRVVIENNVHIGASCTIDRGVTGDTTIGDGTKLDNQVHVGHDTIIGKKCLIASQVGIAGCVVIEDEVILWGQVGITSDVVIGEKAIISAKAGVSKSLEGHKSYFGAPADDFRKKYKEIANIRKIPELIEKIEKLEEKKE